MVLNTVGFIPDGNRRYAKKSSVSLMEAYSKGFENAENVLDWCEETGVKNVILWGFSTENFYRSEEEKELLFSLFPEYLKRMHDSEKLVQRKARVHFAGVPDFLEHENIRGWVKKIEAKTSGFDSGKNIYICLGYGGRKELFDVFRRNSFGSEEEVLKRLWVPVEPDLIIRTGGYQRLSGFMLWQSAYSELYFTKKLWPEFGKNDFEKAVEFYNSSKRNFGV